jgi:tRNA dimethylallyltransferase
MNGKRRAVLIAGPTASGKSALALEKAQMLGGVIVNADSMQIYDVLNIVTARPPAEDLALVPHRLYGFVPPNVRFSTGAWLEAVRELIDETAADQTPLVFVGGTGLYFDALLNGVAAVPPVPVEYVLAAEAELEALDREGRAALLEQRDPQMATRIVEPDRQRVARALSVLAATGKSLAEWQDAGQTGLLDEFDVERLVIDPDPEILRQRIAQRFEKMMDSGAIAEVEALMALDLDPSLPVMKAIGVREIAAWQAGEMTREQAVEKAIIATRQYAKRQRTWLRNRMGDWPRAA